MNLFESGRRTLPMILQEANGECGIACMAMIAHWHGHRLDLTYLRSQYRTTRRGLSLSDLASVADQLRFDVRGFRVDDFADLAHVRTPAILHWDNNHFVVLKSVRRGRVVIHNPAMGVRTYDMAEFGEHFSGTVLEVSPGGAFETIVRAKKYTLSRIFDLTHGLKSSLIQVIVVATAGAVIAMLMPMIVQVALDSVLPRNDLDLLWVLAVGLMLVSISTAVATWIQKRVIANAGSAFFAQLTRNAVGHIFRLPLRYFEGRHPGDVATRLDSIDSVRNVVTKSFSAAAVDLIMILLSGAIMFLYAPGLAALVSAIFLIVIAIRLTLYPYMRRQGAVALKAKSDERSRLIDNLRAVAAIKTGNATIVTTNRWYDSLVRHVNASFRIQITEANAVLLVELVTALGMAVTLYYGVAAVLLQQMTVGMLYAFFTYRTIFFDRIDNLVTTMTEVSLLGANMTRLSDFLEEEPEPSDQPIERHIRDAVKLRGVTYRAGFADAPILSDIDFELGAKQGNAIAIMGPSGSGKTTLLKILAGLYTPSEGAMEVDGVGLTTWGLKAYRANVGLVLGADKLVRGSILENVTGFEESPDRGRALSALRVACLDDVVEGLPRGLDTVVSEENGTLSSGQRRRLMLARALYGDPPLLLLDEVTSNLDAETATRMIRALAEHPSTKVITSHDSQVLEICDTVYRMEAGRLTRDAAYEQLSIHERKGL
ncbi:peptidase domain-containing ABC transporter [Sphingomonas sp. CBMAI 2297]|uniref:peptidase domain-containing ABC transporter n=1 Tax=Sphingomonas sp. CBMAI 2297 TaxID=2991720 RepID=UPI0024583D6A|nr:peptidase domain-containing ABC transporter [Sphingomonas sp. CBMAI 2297]MDH4744020.1 peptidase domain-containing ABC transporter [Sphingomonas sp. CBMAI 2297]